MNVLTGALRVKTLVVIMVIILNYAEIMLRLKRSH